MEEASVTIDGVTMQIPKPFFVMATQNPIEYEGTYPLPEAQLDRFLLKIKMGYPTPKEEMEVLEAHGLVYQTGHLYTLLGRERRRPAMTLQTPGAYRDVGIAWSTEKPMLPSARLLLDHAVSTVPTQMTPAARRAGTSTRVRERSAPAGPVPASRGR